MSRHAKVAVARRQRNGHMTAAAAASGLVLGGLLTFASALPAAGQPAPTAPQVEQATPSGQATFSARVRNELADWRGKMDSLDQRVDATGHRTADAAGVSLRAAWIRTEDAGQKVQTASAQDWDSVKASYESASHELALEWDKLAP
jgi:hypothetical protein